MSMMKIGSIEMSGLEVSHCIAGDDVWVPEQHYRSADLTSDPPSPEC